MNTRAVGTASLLMLELILTACSGLRPPYRCTDPLGCVEIGKGAPLTIGSLVATSGDYASIGEDAQRGIQLAIQDQEYLLGHLLFLATQETDCTQDGARAAATTLLLYSQLLAVIGPTCGVEMAPAGELLTEAGVLAVSPSGTSWGPGFEVPLVSFTPEADLSAAFAIQRLQARQVVIVGSAPESFQAADALLRAMSRTGVSARLLQIPAGSLEFQSQLADLEANPPDVLVLQLPPTQGGLFTAQLRATPGLESLKIIAWENLLGLEFLQSAGPAAAGLYVIGPDQSVFSAAYPRYAQEYEKDFGEAPIAVSDLYAYTVTQMILHAIQAAAIQTSPGSLSIPRSALQKAIQRPGRYTGSFGFIACAGSGGCSTISPAIYQIRGPDLISWYPGNPPGQIYP
jgi:branched-chain amino acid transport system substrate-binding protein